MIDLTPVEKVNSNANGINNRGEIVGEIQKGSDSSYAVLWYQGRTIKLDAVSGGIDSSARSINDLGQIVGNEVASATSISVLWTSPNTVVTLKPLGGGDFVTGINDNGQIVGTSLTSKHTFHAALWWNGSVFDLNNLIPPHCGWILSEAQAINNHGEITGSGSYHGKTRAFLLVPQK